MRFKVKTNLLKQPHPEASFENHRSNPLSHLIQAAGGAHASQSITDLISKALQIAKHDSMSACPSRPPLTEVDVVVTSPLTVHLVDEEAGQGFQDEAEDGHAHTEAKCVLVSFM